MEKPVLEFKNGNDIHFNYSSQVNLPTNNDTDGLSTKKKKKKKKKKKSAQTFSVNDATLNDPDADYPESRVIKFDSEGNVVVESLDEEYPAERVQSNPSPVNEAKPTREFSLFNFNNDDERKFWADLPQQRKSEIVNVDPNVIMERFYQQCKAHKGDDKELICDCTTCGRNLQAIEEELGIVYREYLDNIIDFIQKLRPDALETMMHSDLGLKHLEPSSSLHHKEALSKEVSNTSDELLHEEESHLAPRTNLSQSKAPFEDHRSHVSSEQLHDLTTGERQDLPNSLLKDAANRVKFKEMCMEGLRLEEELRSRVMFAKGLRKELMDRYKDTSKIPHYLLETLNFVDTTSPAIERSMELLSNLGDVSTGDVSEEKVIQASDEINVFAELILKNDGRSFVDIVESLMKQEKDKKRIEEIEDDNPELEHYALRSPVDIDTVLQNEGYNVGQSEIHRKLHDHGDFAHEHDEEHPHDPNSSHHHGHEDELYEQEEEEDYVSEYEDEYDYHHDHNCGHHHDCDHDHDCHHDCEHEEHYDEDSEQESDEESEYSRLKRIEEVRGFFMIQAVTSIRQKFREVYEKKISEDRTQKFIEELEAEENAKKEKELKKLKQKEKQKEKKRQQQQQKEEEKKRREAEELEKEEELKRKREELRAEQLRRKEELRVKKEEEKLKKIEALKKKELEQQKINEQKLKLKEEKLKEEKLKKEAEEKAAKLKAAEQQEASRKKKLEAAALATPELVKDSTAPTIKAATPDQPPGLAPVQLTNEVPLQAEPVQASNHLLDQLYQAQPRSLSSNSNFNQSHQLSSLTGSLYSPTKQTSLTAPLEHPSYSGRPNENGTNLLTLQLGQQNNTSFSPFTDSTPGLGERWPANPLVDSFLTSNSVLGGQVANPGPSVWSNGYASRNNSIWNSDPSPQNQASMMWSSPVTQNAGMVSGARPSLTGETVYDANSIQAAAFDAFCALQKSNQVTFGMASAIQLFQTTKSVLNHPSLGMADFLNTLRTGGRYQFDFVYDDFGSVTHIKVSSVNLATPPLSVSMRPSMPSQFLTPMQQTMPGHGQPPLAPTANLQQPLLSFPHQQLPQGHSFGLENDMMAFSHGQVQGEQQYNSLDISLPGTVQGLLNRMGFGQSKGGIW